MPSAKENVARSIREASYGVALGYGVGLAEGQGLRIQFPHNRSHLQRLAAHWL
jgi:hypothetical protein